MSAIDPASEPFGAIGRETSVGGFAAAMGAAGPLDGWAFDVDLGGTVCYVRPDEQVSVYCTPDWTRHEPGEINIQVVDAHGHIHEDATIPWPVGPSRTIARYRELVVPFLRKHATTEVLP